MHSQMDTALQPLRCTPRQSLQVLLREFIDAQSKSLGKITLLDRHNNSSNFSSNEFDGLVVSLKRVRHATRLIYSSAIAHQLVARSGFSATDLATEVANMVSAFVLDQLKDRVYTRLPKVVLQKVEIQGTLSGTVQFEFRDSAIAYWLNSLMRLPATSPLPFTACYSLLNSESHKPIFAIQHAHARCCSLLRLAHRENLITLDLLEADPNRWQFSVPASVPWLTPDCQLYTSRPVERQLITQLLVTLDRLSEIDDFQAVVPYPDWDSSGNHKSGNHKFGNYKQTLQLATNLSQAFQDIHQDIQILGDSFQSEPCDRLYAHLGLILATQRSLHLLLQNCLGIHAPHEL